MGVSSLFGASFRTLLCFCDRWFNSKVKEEAENRLDDGHRNAITRIAGIFSQRCRYRQDIFFFSSVGIHNPHDEFAHCRGCCGFRVCSAVFNTIYLSIGRQSIPDELAMPKQ